MVRQAVITAAGRHQRHLLLQTVTDPEGYPRPVIDLITDELAGAGLERIGLVVAPGDERLYLDGLARHAGRLTFISQTEPMGYGHAVWCARPFTGDEPFVLMVNDHITVSDDPTRSCVRQLIDLYERHRVPMSAVQATPESELTFFGCVGGRLHEGQPGVYAIDKVMEKPTPTQAEEELLVPGLRRGYYLGFFGLHLLSPTVMDLLEAEMRDHPGQKITLSNALHALAGRERYLAVELRGRRYDLEGAHGLLIAQLALALSGRKREELLAALIRLLAQPPRS